MMTKFEKLQFLRNMADGLRAKRVEWVMKVKTGNAFAPLTLQRIDNDLKKIADIMDPLGQELCDEIEKEHGVRFETYISATTKAEKEAEKSEREAKEVKLFKE